MLVLVDYPESQIIDEQAAEVLESLKMSPTDIINIALDGWLKFNHSDDDESTEFLTEALLEVIDEANQSVGTDGEVAAEYLRAFEIYDENAGMLFNITLGQVHHLSSTLTPLMEGAAAKDIVNDARVKLYRPDANLVVIEIDANP